MFLLSDLNDICADCRHERVWWCPRSLTYNSAGDSGAISAKAGVAAIYYLTVSVSHSNIMAYDLALNIYGKSRTSI